MKFVIILVVLLAVGATAWAVVQARRVENEELNAIGKLPASIGHVVAQMDPSQQAAFFHEYQSRKKSLVSAYLGWLFFGVYYFYFKQPVLNALFWAAWVVGIGEVWWIIDFFRMPSIRRTYNEDVARQALQTLQMGQAFSRPQWSPPPGGPSA